MSILKLSLLRFKDKAMEIKLGKIKERKKQRLNFADKVGKAVAVGLDHYYFDGDKIHLIIKELTKVGYTIEKKNHNQFRVSGWSV